MPLLIVDGHQLYFRLEGREGAPRLLLLHPVGADHSFWDAVVPTLARQYQVLRPDLRGHGGSTTPAGPDYSAAMLADDILAICDHLNWHSFAAAGVSIGGITAMQLALQAPGRITALVLCSAAARMHEPPNGGWQGRADAVRAQGLVPQADGMVARMFSPSHRATDDPLVDTLRQVFVLNDAEGYAASLAVLRDTDLRGQLCQLDMPALVVTGAQDQLIPAAASQILLDSLPHAKSLVLDTGHFPPVEAPQAFAEAVDDFLRLS